MPRKTRPRRALKRWLHFSAQQACLIEISCMLTFVCLLEQPSLLNELGAFIQFALQVVQLLQALNDSVLQRFVSTQRWLFALGIGFTLLASACGTAPPQPKASAPLILYTTAALPQFDTRSVSWARNTCQNNSFGLGPNPQWEWTPVVQPTQEYDNPVVALSGTAVRPRISVTANAPGGPTDVTEDFSGNAYLFDPQADLPFTHPFGTDFDMWIAPDQRYYSLLAPLSTSPATRSSDTDYGVGWDQAKTDGIDPFPPGILGLETDRRLIPITYRPYEKDRVVAFGRWIVDCGHDDFLSEIHPPLLLASANSSQNTTNLKVISRPFLVGQDFLVGGKDDGAFVKHLDHEVREVKGLDSCFPIPFGFPCSKRLELHPQIYTTPFTGVQIMQFYVSPPTTRLSPQEKLLVSGHFTLRSGVSVTISKVSGQDQLLVTVTMNDLNYKPAKLPQKYDRVVHVSDFTPGDQKKIYAIYQLYPDGALGPAYSQGILAKGFLTDSYDPPLAQSPLDTQNVVTNESVDNLSPSQFYSVDDNQPFPIYGSLTLQWKPTTVKITSPADQSSFGQSSIGSRQTNPITFTASASDSADVLLTGTALKWSYDGSPFGTGESFSTTLKTDPCGISPHKVTVTATDSAGHSTSDTITLYIGNIC